MLTYSWAISAGAPFDGRQGSEAQIPTSCPAPAYLKADVKVTASNVCCGPISDKPVAKEEFGSVG